MKDLSPHKIIHCSIPTLIAFLIIFFTPQTSYSSFFNRRQNKSDRILQQIICYNFFTII